MTTSTPNPRRVQRVRHELHIRPVHVVRTERTSPGFVAVTFGGDALAGFTSLSFDDHVKLVLPGGGDGPVRRDYTPRHFDAVAGELTIEFALHASGAASDWARQAAPGQPASIGGPRGSFVVPPGYDWHLLVGDATALPAIARRLEELPAGAHVQVLAQVPDEQDRRAFAGRPGVQWFATPAGLLQAVQALALPAGEGFVWCAGEAAMAAQLRQLLLGAKGHPREAARIAAYWKQGASSHHEDLA